MLYISRLTVAIICMIGPLGTINNALAADDCARWPTSKLEDITFKAIASRNTTLDGKKISPDDLIFVEKSAFYSSSSLGWYLEFKVSRPNPSKPIFISMVSCTGHVEFGSRLLSANEVLN